MIYVFTYKQLELMYEQYGNGLYRGIIIRKNHNQVGGEPYRRPTRIYPK